MEKRLSGPAREKYCAEVARRAAAESMVLLKNDGDVLPLGTSGTARVALFGIGQVYTFKGGTGSGDVNNARTVNILEGLSACDGLEVDAQLAGAYRLYAVSHPNQAVEKDMQLQAAANPEMPLDAALIRAAAERNDCAIYVLSRISGEFLDRKETPGDYLLTPEETALIQEVCGAFSKTILVLNTPGSVDLSDVQARFSAIVYMSLAGQEGGHALADVLTGKTTPSGRLTATWPLHWADCISSENFGGGRTNGNVNAVGFGPFPGEEKEQVRVDYAEGIFTGYRYFDTFGKDVLYPFGFGLSYARLHVAQASLSLDGEQAEVHAEVENLSETFSGRETVQVYVSKPDGELEKPWAELIAFAKTGEIAPGGRERVKMTFPLDALASFSEARCAWILEPGYYYIRLGVSSRDTAVIGAFSLSETVEIRRVRPLLGHPPADFAPLGKAGAVPITYSGEAEEKRAAERSAIRIVPRRISRVKAKYKTPAEPKPLEPFTEFAVTAEDVRAGRATVEELASQFTLLELCQLCSGLGMDFSGLAGLESGGGAMVGQSAALRVPGAAGATAAFPERGLPALMLADGPAGLRLRREVPATETREAFRQNCTAFPVGTLLASSWDTALLEEVGACIALEMREYGVDLWLAPGMNIQRNPLCGRNFEYFAEDPLVSGACAAAITKGVQRRGVGVTIKHFAGNNQETERTNSTSNIPQRALREIYLRGFEIAVRTAQPWAIMTSYNDINGVPAADNFDLCTAIARDEWGFQGLIMTDWGGGLSRPALSMYAGNDLIQPGGEAVVQELFDAVTAGEAVTSRGAVHFRATPTLAMLQRSAVHILKIVLKRA